VTATLLPVGTTSAATPPPEQVGASTAAARTAGVVVRAAPGAVVTTPTAGAALRCPTTAPRGSLTDGSAAVGVARLCSRAVAGDATAQARGAIRAAFHMLGAPYACGGVGRMDAFRFDCSSLVSRAYAVGAGLPTAGKTWAPSTRDMMPWDGRALAPWAVKVKPVSLHPGDLVLYNTGAALSRHVVMYLGNGWILHTNACGEVARVAAFWGLSSAAAPVRGGAPGHRAPCRPARPHRPVDDEGGPAATVSFSRLMAHRPAETVRVQVALNRVVRVGQQPDGRWDGGLYSDIVGFRRWAYGMSSSEASYPVDRATLRDLGRRAGFTLTA
jgi:cell wall-associated NlpC family hydrolase